MTTDNKALAERFRKKPVVIEAMQFDGTVESASAICRWVNADDAAKGHDDPTVSFVTRDNHPGKALDMLVWTMEGDMTASPGDWIIRGVQGEHYPCKPDIFAATYEPAALTREPSTPSAQSKEPSMSLHPETEALVDRFAAALKEKLAAAERKYGYSDGWRSPDWMDECRTKLVEHVQKGDPRDVAAYCAFLWHHEASTTPPAAGRCQPAPR